MKGISIVILGCILTACSTVNESKETITQPTEAEKTAITQLKKIHSDIELGLNMSEYKEKVSEAKFAVEQVNTDSKIINSLDKVIEGHIIALNWWECDLEVNDSFDPSKCRDEILPTLFTYSSVIKEEAEPLLEKDSSLPKSWNIDSDQMLQLIWQETQTHLILAESTILAKPQPLVQFFLLTVIAEGVAKPNRASDFFSIDPHTRLEAIQKVGIPSFPDIILIYSSRYYCLYPLLWLCLGVFSPDFYSSSSSQFSSQSPSTSSTY